MGRVACVTAVECAAAVALYLALGSELKPALVASLPYLLMLLGVVLPGPREISEPYLRRGPHLLFTGSLIICLLTAIPSDTFLPMLVMLGIFALQIVFPVCVSISYLLPPTARKRRS